MVENLLTPEEQAAIAEDVVPPADDQQIDQTQQPRDEAGRFAPIQPESQEQPRQQTRQVPHGALHAEREAHKHTKSELQQLRERLSQLAQLRDRLVAPVVEQEQPAPAAQPQQVPPAGQQQPQGDAPGLDHLRNRLQVLESERRQDIQRRDIDTVNTHETQLITAEIRRSEMEFAQQTPDYQDAVNHLVGARARELQRYGMDPLSIQQAIQSEALDLARSAINMGMSPAEMAYAVAQDRGYRGAQQPQGQPNPAAQMLDAIAKGQKASRSLSSAPGATAQTEISADAVASMSEADFMRLWATPDGRKMLESIG